MGRLFTLPELFKNHEYSDQLDATIQVVERAGIAVMDVLDGASSRDLGDVRLKGGIVGNIQTNGDRRSSDEISRSHQEFLPGIPRVDEEIPETHDLRSRVNEYTIYDPIDSSNDFHVSIMSKLEGRLLNEVLADFNRFNWSVQVAHVKRRKGEDGVLRGKVVYAVGYRPLYNDLVIALEGVGAVSITEYTRRVLTPTDDQEIVLLASRRRYMGTKLPELVNALGREHTVRYMSGSWRAVEVARGNGTVYCSPPGNMMKVWDVPLGELMIQEVKGRCSDVFGNEVDHLGPIEIGDKGLLYTANAHLHKIFLSAGRNVFRN
ncbi:MAG: inositol monophosphatase family protein [Candidatus Woesearchaeota archaeon]